MTKRTAVFIALAAGIVSAVASAITPESLAGYANLSATLARLVLVGAIGMALLTWRQQALELGAADLRRARSSRPVQAPRPVLPYPQPADGGDGRSASQLPEIDVCETLSNVEQAKVLLSLGRVPEAADALAAVAERPAETVVVWLADGAAAHPTSVFNVDWFSAGCPDKATMSLEDFPHVIDAVVRQWGQPACAVYLDCLLLDTRDGKRTGFPLAAAEEIALLRQVLERRLSHGTRARSAAPMPKDARDAIRVA